MSLLSHCNKLHTNYRHCYTVVNHALKGNSWVKNICFKYIYLNDNCAGSDASE